ncbi:hypothetical protein PspLS_11192 [Pyricularia sp. CBS 133598]|nr:hypothetical protein PspLS_11192 [Pyricularia sp. CBS 133598]
MTTPDGVSTQCWWFQFTAQSGISFAVLSSAICGNPDDFVFSPILPPNAPSAGIFRFPAAKALRQLANFDSHSLCLWYSQVARTQARGDSGDRDRIMGPQFYTANLWVVHAERP